MFWAAYYWRYFLDYCFDFGLVMIVPEAVTSLFGIVGWGWTPLLLRFNGSD